ncbi:F-box/LRR-repeat protein [Prunus yedoensis var. nudiflora]|uniref:F-box/LRR-repeat protein n=1 Tax=Prunus yedoensis var. nudiflora TaxID=2094558 RepID=A0A314U737_PRUYE|nr:F-box/LRR-repeat protein [Prunus yedoensis var. nudiflora]
MVVLLDVDSGGIRAVQVGSSSMSDCDDLMPVDVFSYTGGYISLRKYADLMEAKTGEGNFFSVGKMMQRSMLPGSQAADSIRLCGFEKPELVETASQPLELN